MTNGEEIINPTDKAILKCAEWLAYCLKIGWDKKHLVELEDLWWKYHDNRGNLINNHSQNKVK